MEVFILFGVLFLLVFLGLPVAFCLALSAMACAIASDLPISLVFQRMVSGVQVYSLIAVPFFIFAGEIISAGGLAKIIVNLANALVGRIRGGLGLVNVASSMLFGGISGSAVADTSAIGSVMIPMMKEKSYPADFAVNVTISSSIIGVLIPPSHNMIIYAIAAGGSVSIGSLFVAGVLPGLLVGLGLMLVTYILSVRYKCPAEKAIPIGQLLKYLLQATPGLFTLIIIVGGILSGFFTATESASVAVVYAILISVLFYRELTWHKLKEAMLAAVKTSVMVFFIIACANSFSWLMAYHEVPEKLISFLTQVTDSPSLIYLIVVFTLIGLGTFMDMAPLIVITTPIFLPVVTELGMNPLQFGIIMMGSLGLGLITPPVGTVLFAGASIGKVKIEDLMRTIWPFYLAIIFVILLVTYIPQLTLYPVSLFQ